METARSSRVRWDKCRNQRLHAASVVAVQTLAKVWRALSKQDVGSIAFLVFSLLLAYGCAIKHVWQYVCLQISMSMCSRVCVCVCVCVCSLWLCEPERRKRFLRDSPQSGCQSQMGGVSYKKDEDDVRCVSSRQQLCFDQNYRKIATRHVTKSQISGGWSASVNHSLHPGWKTHLGQKYG